MTKNTLALWTAAALAALAAGCDTGPQRDVRGQGPGYRTGTEEDGYLSNGERGNVLITEINWAGSVTDDGLHDPTDIFIELQNKHPRPIHLTNWQLVVEAGTGRPGVDSSWGRGEHPRQTFVIPPREGGQPVGPNEFVVIATRADGAVVDPDYVIPTLRVPRDRFIITLRDPDDRLIGGAGDANQAIFAGSFDLVTVRSMERVQLIFANQDGRESSWHSYGYNPWDDDHEDRLQFIRDGFKERTFASPRRANSPDYSGNTASGDFQ